MMPSGGSSGVPLIDDVLTAGAGASGGASDMAAPGGAPSSGSMMDPGSDPSLMPGENAGGGTVQVPIPLLETLLACFAQHEAGGGDPGSSGGGFGGGFGGGDDLGDYGGGAPPY